MNRNGCGIQFEARPRKYSASYADSAARLQGNDPQTKSIVDSIRLRHPDLILSEQYECPTILFHFH